VIIASYRRHAIVVDEDIVQGLRSGPAVENQIGVLEQITRHRFASDTVSGVSGNLSEGKGMAGDYRQETDDGHCRPRHAEAAIRGVLHRRRTAARRHGEMTGEPEDS
jgi:hypothetical protein